MKSEVDLRQRPVFLRYFKEYCEFRMKSKKLETGLTHLIPLLRIRNTEVGCTFFFLKSRVHVVSQS